ncbi:MAG: hypothetical protein JNL59_15795 [Chitinophagaceae bacterium]|jgi:signal transduction histidine kinase|nr:hypothetical protein [Chitinophagaceae bacterium]
MKDNLIMNADMAHRFGQSLHQLGHAVLELQKLSYTLAPEPLEQLGLDAAMEELCRLYSEPGIQTISYQPAGMAAELISNSVSIAIYRITEALLGPTNTPASIKKISTGVDPVSQSINLTLTDVRSNFDITYVSGSQKDLWLYVNHYIVYMNGSISFHPAVDDGTEIRISFPV